MTPPVLVRWNGTDLPEALSAQRPGLYALVRVVDTDPVSEIRPTQAAGSSTRERQASSPEAGR